MRFFLLLSLFMAIGFARPNPGYFNNNIDLKLQQADKNLYSYLSPIDNNETEQSVRQMYYSTYNLHAFRANYLLPVSYGVGRHYYNSTKQNHRKTSVQFQFSLRYDFAANVFGLHGIYSVAYTQHSFWQAYAKSAYFRESNYNPEIFVTIPSPWKHRDKYIKAFRFSLEHQSNGRGGADERSWNFVTGSVYTQYKNIFVQLKGWARIYGTRDYNPDLLDYLGHGSLKIMVPYKKNVFKLLLRSNFSSHGAAKFSYSYPLAYTNGLFLYVQAFSGYGETLIDYNHYVNSVSIGFSLSR